MRSARRTIASVIAALLVSVVLAIPASAAQVITYEGNTSAAERNGMKLKVTKRDDGRRFLTRLRVRYTLTCEDASTFEEGVSIGWGRGVRLDDAGEFSWDYPPEGEVSSWHFEVEGAIGFRHASGTLTVAQSALTDDFTDSQFCTTGPLDWTAERTDTQPAHRNASMTPEGTRFTKIRVSGGVAEVVRVRSEP